MCVTATITTAAARLGGVGGYVQAQRLTAPSVGEQQKCCTSVCVWGGGVFIQSSCGKRHFSKFLRVKCKMTKTNIYSCLRGVKYHLHLFEL